MTCHSCLVDLPTGLGAEILTRWLGLADRRRLDSAYCSRVLRAEWLNLLSSPECALKAHLFRKRRFTTDDVFRWALPRNVSVGKILMDPSSCSNKIYKKYIEQHGSSITEARGHCTLPRGILTFATCTNLLKMDLYMCVLTSALRQVFVHCKQLREFLCNLDSHGNNPPSTIKSTDLKGLSCPSIKVMHLRWCWDRGSSLIAAALIRLAVSLDVLVASALQCTAGNIVKAMSPTITTFSKSKGFMSSESFCRFVARCTGLVHLSLRRADITTGMIDAMGAHLQHLKSLDMSESESIDDSIFRALAVSCGDRLTELLVVECGNLSLPGMEEALPKFTKLTSFGFSYCEEEDNHSVLDYTLLSRFTTLYIDCTNKETDQFLTRIAHNCPHLEHFSFQWWNEDLEGTDLDFLIARCPQLRTLSVESEVEVEEHLQRWKGLRPELVVKWIFF